MAVFILFLFLQFYIEVCPREVSEHWSILIINIGKINAKFGIKREKGKEKKLEVLTV